MVRPFYIMNVKLLQIILPTYKYMETTIIAYTGLVTSIAGIIYGMINHKRIRSHCCGKVIVASIDIEATTPPVKIEPKDCAEQIEQNETKDLPAN